MIIACGSIAVPASLSTWELMTMANIHAVKFREIQTIVSTLQKGLTTGYGPSFQHTVISTTSGKVLITNKGIDILKTLNISHPIAQYIISCVSNNQLDSGDDSKTFMAMLNELFTRSESIVVECGSNSNQSHHRESVTRLAQDVSTVLNDILPALFLAMDRFCSRSQLTVGKNLEVGCKSLVMGAMNSHLLEYDASHMANLLVKWLLCWIDADGVESIVSVVNLILDNLNIVVLQNPGHTLASSSLLPGFLVSRGYCNVEPSQSYDAVDGETVKFLLMNCSIETASDDFNHQIEFQLPDPEDQAMVERIITQKRKRTEEFIHHINRLGIKLILTTVQLSTLEKTLCSRCGIAAVNTIPEDELNYISAMLNLHILTDIHELTKENIGNAKSCRQSVIGSHNHLNLQVIDTTAHPSCLIISAPTEGICHQTANLISDSLKVVRSALVSHGAGYQDNSRDVVNVVASMENLSTCSSVARSSRRSEGGDSGICLAPHEPCGDPSGSLMSPLSTTSTSPSGTLVKSDFFDDEPTSECICTIPVGGAFELALHEVICNYLSTQPAGAVGTTALSLIKESLLSIPQLIHSNAFYIAKPRWLFTLSSARGVIKCGKAISIDPNEGTPYRTTLSHPFHSKCQTLIRVLTTFHQLLKLDHVI